MLGYNSYNISIILKNFKDSFKKCGINADVQLENRDRAISAYNTYDQFHDEYLFIWIRILPSHTGKYILDISSIILPKSKRGCGTLDIIYKRLLRCKYVETVRIVNPCTQSMNKWIKKHNLKDVYLGTYA